MNFFAHKNNGREIPLPLSDKYQCMKWSTMLMATTSKANPMANTFVQRANLLLSVLALFFDKKVSAPPVTTPIPLELPSCRITTNIMMREKKNKFT